jgi:hypothetical protein
MKNPRGTWSPATIGNHAMSRQHLFLRSATPTATAPTVEKHERSPRRATGRPTRHHAPSVPASEEAMSFQAYLDNVEKKTGRTPQQLIDEAADSGLTATATSSPG